MAKAPGWKKVLDQQSQENIKAFDTWRKENKTLFNKMSQLEKTQMADFGKVWNMMKNMTLAGKDFLSVAKETEKSIKQQVAAGHPLQAVGKSIANSWKDYEKYSKSGTALDKKKAKVISGVADISTTLLGNAMAIGTEEFQSLNLNRQIAQARALGLENQVKDLELLKKEQDALDIVHKKIVSQKEAIMSPFAAMDDFIKRIPIIGDTLSSQFNIKGWGEKMVAGFEESIAQTMPVLDKDYNSWLKENTGKYKGKGWQAKASKDWKAELKNRTENNDKAEEANKMAAKRAKLMKAAVIAGGAVAAFWYKIGKYAMDTGLSLSQVASLGPALLINSAAVKAFSQEFGTVLEINTQLAAQLQWQSKKYGVQAADQAKILKLVQGISGEAKTVIASDMSGMMEDMRKAGVEPGKTVAAMAQNSEFLSKYVGGSVKEMGKFAVEAAKSGVSLQAIEASMKGALDWESSINKEMEASVLLGKEISLDKFRELSFNEDATGALNEQMRILRSLGPLDQLRIDQKEVLGEMFNMEYGQLVALQREQDVLNSAGDQQVSTWNKVTGAMMTWGSTAMGLFPGAIALMSQMSMIFGPKLTKNMARVGGLFLEVGKKAMLGAGKMLMSAGAYIIQAISSVWAAVGAMTASTLGFGAPVAIAMGIGMVAAIWASVAKAKSKAPGKAMGGPVQGMNPYMVGEKGPELFIPSGQGNIIPNNRLAGGTADRVYGDTSKQDAKFDTMIGLLSQANNDRNTGNKKLGRDMEGAFQQR